MAEINLTAAEKEDIEKIAKSSLGWSKLRNSAVLISGGTGFIGSTLINVLKCRNAMFKDGIKIICLSRSREGEEDEVRYIRADVNNPVNIDCKADYILHLASNTHPAQYSAYPVETITANVIGCNNLLKFAADKGCRRFFLASSVEIYGNGGEVAMDEDYCGYINCNNARSGYNEAKRVSESLCKSYFEQYGVDFVTARFARVFGADRKNDTKALAQFMDRAIRGEDIVLKSEGRQRFSYCYVTDAVSALLKILLSGKSGEAYNVAADDEGMTLGEYAAYIASLADKKVIFDLKNAQKGASGASYALLDCGKLKALGWSPEYSVKEGLKKTFGILKEIKL